MATHPGATGWRDPHRILVAEEKQSAGTAKAASFALKTGFPLLICAPRMTTDIYRDTSAAVDRNALPVRPRPHFATAEPANTPLDLKRSRVFKREIADIRFAIVRIINAPGLFPRAFRSHADEKLQPIIGRFASLVFGFLSSTCGFPVALSIGDLSQTTRPHSAAPHRLTATLASPAWVSQTPDGSSALEATAPQAAERRNIPLPRGASFSLPK